MSAARHLRVLPASDARVVYLDERRAAGDGRLPAPALRLVKNGDEGQILRLDVFLRRARAVLAESDLGGPGMAEIPPRSA
jgi:hypothetical protein